MALPRILRTVEATAGLLSAGVLLSGVVLAVLAAVAPALIGGSGLSATDGPRLDRILVPLIVGGAGESMRLFRPRWNTPVRAVAAVAVVVASLLALWWGWWR
ncbi:hypothetical protein SAMN04515671_4169 [Nakamurella panacisegetis]|uniref:Uncharacterized protein n=1 Tax=Nakamurella panacisegetis TaxID=1090615 RepID=A0A1H0SMS4_9ACTN|nr:hypothetical protein [Nakamurella panacisegetis]SDP42466.1 hypothetical protein SAMN04515671_4169 [Nakamurella panacisegetis]